MTNIINNKTILITGGTGTVGSEIIFSLLKYNFRTIRVLTNDENSIFEFQNQLERKLSKIKKINLMKKFRFLFGDIREIERCKKATEKVDIIIHAAAMKHVSICEYNPDEAIKTNVIGTQNLISAAIYNKVSNFLHISTDKVVDASTVLGQTKILAEKIVIESSKSSGNPKIKFSALRFGNVLGSRGSVIDKYNFLLKNKLPITVTDKLMTRYFMTKKMASDMILKSLKVMRGGEIFILPSMGKLRIYDLAVVMSNIYNSKNKIILKHSNYEEKIDEQLFTNSEKKFIIKKNGFYVIKTDHTIKNKKNNKIKNLFIDNKHETISQKKLKFLIIKENLIQ
jgi:UDP-N-acetylglucosamine 4,6-dehydratase